MIPKEKAIELVGKMCGNNCTEKNVNKKKKFALIAVNEIINNIKPIEIKLFESSFKTDEDFYENLKLINANVTRNLINEKLYWQQVKKEIKKI